MEVRKIGVVGMGVVGSATARSYLEYADKVWMYDLVQERSNCDFGHCMEQSDLVFVCLPTPPSDDGYDLTAINSFCAEIQGWNGVVVLKSTLLPGSTEQLSRKYNLTGLVHSPEFLTARCSYEDALNPSRHLIGVTERSEWAGRILATLYKKRWPGIAISMMKSEQTEISKLALNSFFAVKIAFFNELRSICDTLGFTDDDWENVRCAMIGDGRVTANHTNVPGHDGERGFGGACLPKDLNAFIALANKQGINPYIGFSAQRANEEWRSNK